MQINRTVMIVAIVICGLLLIALLWAIVKKFLKNMTWGTALISLAVLLVILGVLAFFLFAPRGRDSLFSSNVNGGEQGDTAQNTDLEEQGKGTGLGFSMDDALEGNASGDKTVYINIHGREISIGNRTFEDVDSLIDAVNSISTEMKDICLVDDYAVADTYMQVENALDELVIKYNKTEK